MCGPRMAYVRIDFNGCEGTQIVSHNRQGHTWQREGARKAGHWKGSNGSTGTRSEDVTFEDNDALLLTEEEDWTRIGGGWRVGLIYYNRPGGSWVRMAEHRYRLIALFALGERMGSAKKALIQFVFKKLHGARWYFYLLHMLPIYVSQSLQ